MTTRHHTKLVHEGDYVAEVDVELIDSDTGWSPYLSLDDAYRIDYVRAALRRGDLKAATGLARIFSLCCRRLNSSGEHHLARYAVRPGTAFPCT